MYWKFLSYYFKALRSSRLGQRPLWIAILGLCLSSFSLLVLQSTMRGLQNGLVARSKVFTGEASIILRGEYRQNPKPVMEWLKKKGLAPSLEYEIELLARHENYLAPTILHGMDQEMGVLPAFLGKEKLQGTILGADLSSKLRVRDFQEVRFISPSHTNALLGDVPRMATLEVSKVLRTDVPEVDLVHGFVRIEAIQNLIREKSYNRIRFYPKDTLSIIKSGSDWAELQKELQAAFPQIAGILDWEGQHASLVWALKLETVVMLCLFVAMSLLVAIAVTSGNLLFFDQIKLDLVGFWILGMPFNRMDKMARAFLHALSFFSSMAGLILALIFLWVLDHYGELIMPEVFIEKKIPILITSQGVLISLCVPYGVSLFFSSFSLRSLKLERENFLGRIRALS